MDPEDSGWLFFSKDRLLGPPASVYRVLAVYSWLLACAVSICIIKFYVPLKLYYVSKFEDNLVGSLLDY